MGVSIKINLVFFFIELDTSFISDVSTQSTSILKLEYILSIIIVISFLISSDVEIGRYQLTVSMAISQKGKVYVIETVLDTKTGKIVDRKKISLSTYQKVKTND